MRAGARRDVVNQLKQLGTRATELASEIEHESLPDLRRVGIGWGSKSGAEIDVGGTYVFKVGRDEKHVVEIIQGLAWGLFESSRDPGNPSDPDRSAKVRAILNDVADRLPGGPKWGLRERCPRCDGITHVCVACDAECKIDRSVDHEHTYATKLCPDCSGWLAPQGPR